MLSCHSHERMVMGGTSLVAQVLAPLPRFVGERNLRS
jgi:hypothetical protein